jgi:hypothetical protein
LMNLLKKMELYQHVWSIRLNGPTCSRLLRHGP